MSLPVSTAPAALSKILACSYPLGRDCAGLDSTSAASVVDMLASLTQTGTAVLITIHQPRPDVFNLMQRVLILSSKGQMVFSGKPAELRCGCWVTCGTAGLPAGEGWAALYLKQSPGAAQPCANAAQERHTRSITQLSSGQVVLRKPASLPGSPVCACGKAR